jgi:hypothetical protein
MERHLLLEMCFVSLLRLPEEELQLLTPALAAMAEPYLSQGDDSLDTRELRSCLKRIFAVASGT